MANDPWRIVLLDQTHDRTAFDCGTDDLNRYLQEQAGQNSRRNISRTYVAAVASDPTRIGGYYTLTLRSTGFQELPKEKRLPRYPNSVDTSRPLGGRSRGARERARAASPAQCP